MAEIVPAIIAKSFEELQEKVKLVEPYVNWVQLDVMDGKFAPEKTWPYTTANNCHPELLICVATTMSEVGGSVSGSKNSEMPKQVRHDEMVDIKKSIKTLSTKLNLEAHLMVEEPEKEIDRWLDSGVKRILVHWEAIFRNQESGIGNWKIILRKCMGKNIELGLVLNLDTAINVLSQFPVPGSRFLIQLMSIAQIGYHGHPFDWKVIPKIRALKERYPNVKIAVDGGINKETAEMALSAGADILVAGSVIFGSENIAETIKNLQNN